MLVVSDRQIWNDLVLFPYDVGIIVVVKYDGISGLAS